ncbi:MAG: hypothetical protein COX29_02180 [Candidatus Moranbacteria bacterium CG23_combo_of_CG06-09_8_20_14_all_35_22]|nr:MAG: hypothetical protein COX29_02180 [Candidatus Moranbacteria bacterium CG23_combo_of_CG06-09_8_20_14_all_35_22]
MNEENKNLIEEVKKHFDVKTEEAKKHFDEKTEEVKKHFDLKTEETKRHFDVVAEELKSQFKVFGEQLATVSEDVTMLKEDMDYVKSNLVDKSERFKEINEVADNHEKRLIKLEKISLMKT